MKKFCCRQSVLNAIAKAERKYIKLMANARAEEALALNCGDPDKTKQCEDAARDFVRKARKIKSDDHNEKTKLKMLGAKLAEFDTGALL